MKKRTFFLSLLLAALICAPVMFVACGDPEKGKKWVSSPVGWTAEQVGGTKDTATTVAIKITFDREVYIHAHDVAIGGAATKSDGDFIGGDGSLEFIVPVTVTEAGTATVRIIGGAPVGNAPFIHDNTKSVEVFVKKDDTVNPGDDNPIDGDFANASGFPAGYTGTPLYNPSYRGEPGEPMPEPYADQEGGQKIPGKVMLAYYDEGGTGVSFNAKAGDYKHVLAGLRDDGAAPVGMKQVNTPDDFGGPKNMVDPTLGMTYFGYTRVGEWIKLTVDVSETGLYDLELCYSSNFNGAKFSLRFDEDKKEVITPTWTKSWHCWNLEVITQMSLKKGTCVLTLEIEAIGDFNLCYIDFKKAAV
ncbi:MAG: carbohydrate-binding protein [Firmicutes bacterium]|nr:carbohydrate-binding protein [Bacillota bacterium]